LLSASPGHSLRSASESDPGSFQITASALGLETCEILCKLLKSRVSVFYSPQSLLYASSADLQSWMFWALVLLGQNPPGWGAHCGAWTPHSLERTSAIVIILLFVSQLPRDVGLDYTLSQFFLPISL